MQEALRRFGYFSIFLRSFLEIHKTFSTALCLKIQKRQALLLYGDIYDTHFAFWEQQFGPLWFFIIIRVEIFILAIYNNNITPDHTYILYTFWLVLNLIVICAHKPIFLQHCTFYNIHLNSNLMHTKNEIKSFGFAWHSTI